MTPSPGIKPGPHWWEASDHTTAPPSLLPPQLMFTPHILMNVLNHLQDGLICLFDVSKGSEEDCLDSVLNTGSSVVW